jgi:hypothetical protein
LKKIEILIFLIISTAIIYCCKDEVCTQNLISEVNIKFYDSASHTKAIDTLFLYGMGHSDSMLYDSAPKVSSVLLPLDQNTDLSRFILDFEIITSKTIIYDSIAEIDSIIPSPIPDTVFKYKHTQKTLYTTKTFIDTLTFNYSRQIKMISPECGFITFFELDTILSSNNLIDSILIKTPSIDNNYDDENIKIYF